MGTHYTPYKNGQSLVEVVVAIGVVVLIVSGLVIAVISSLRSAQSSRLRSTATKLTQDGIEIMRNLRDTGWSQFALNDSPNAWCLGLDGILVELPSCTGNIVIGGLTYTRTALLTETSTDQLTVTITVTWIEGKTLKNSNATTYLTKWR